MLLSSTRNANDPQPIDTVFASVGIPSRLESLKPPPMTPLELAEKIHHVWAGENIPHLSKITHPDDVVLKSDILGLFDLLERYPQQIAEANHTLRQQFGYDLRSVANTMLSSRRRQLLGILGRAERYYEDHCVHKVGAKDLLGEAATLARFGAAINMALHCCIFYERRIQRHLRDPMGNKLPAHLVRNVTASKFSGHSDSSPEGLCTLLKTIKDQLETCMEQVRFFKENPGERTKVENLRYLPEALTFGPQILTSAVSDWICVSDCEHYEKKMGPVERFLKNNLLVTLGFHIAVSDFARTLELIHQNACCALRVEPGKSEPLRPSPGTGKPLVKTRQPSETAP